MSYEVYSSPYTHHFKLPSSDIYIATTLNPFLNEGSKSVQFNIPAGNYSASVFIDGLQTKLNTISPNKYTYSVNNEGQQNLIGGVKGFQLGVTGSGNFSIT